MKAIKNHVIIKKQPAAEKVGSIHVVIDSQGHHGESVFATVISAGQECEQVKDGMTVLTQNGVGVNFDGPDGKEYHHLLEDELLAIIE